MKMKLKGFNVFVVFGMLCVVNALHKCPCKYQEDCNHISKDPGSHEEVYVFSNGTADVHLWSWETLTTVVVPLRFNISNSYEASTMCTTHSKGRKFGISVEMDLRGVINETSDAAKQWVTSVVTRQQDWRAEVIVVNLVPYFSSDSHSTSEDHISLVQILTEMKQKASNLSAISVQLSCIVPWMPPCAETEASCLFTKLVNVACDLFIINPESFTDTPDMTCRARASIPLPKLLTGISEYQSHHIPSKNLLLGVPWHGYDFTCLKYDNDVCAVEQITENGTRTQCNYNKRTPVSYGDIYSKFSIKPHKAQIDDLYKAPSFPYKDGSVQHEIWFENELSLIIKYRLVMDLSLKGIGIFYGDDLSATISNKPQVNADLMWSWVGHELMLTAARNPNPDPYHYPDLVTGLSIGCLVLGIILGSVFTFIALRSRVKKPKEPFYRDRITAVDEFTDEDPNL